MRKAHLIKFGLVAFFITLLTSVCMTSCNSYATSHEIQGIRVTAPYSTSGSNSSDSLTNNGFPGFLVVYEPGINLPEIPSLEPSSSNDFYTIVSMNFSYSVSGYCSYIDTSANGYVNNSSSFSTYSLSVPYAPSWIPDSNSLARCHRIGSFTSNSLAVNTSDMSSDIRSYFNEHISPYWYTSDGFYTHSHHINTTDGIDYNSTFKLSQLTGKPVTHFSHLEIPIYNSDYNESCVGELDSSSDLVFKGIFDFDEVSFEWNPDMSTANSKIQIHAYYYNYDVLHNTTTITDSYSPCTTNLVTLQFNNTQQLSFDCPISVTSSYDTLILTFEMLGYDSQGLSPVWLFDSSDWAFGGMYIITDNDETGGCAINDDLQGNYIGGTVDDSSGSDGWFQQLTNMFHFTLINPFSAFINMFTDQSTCAHIPTLASMLHTNNVYVCPWFDTTTRNIVTPVLSLASLVILVGFVFHWLGSSSGNFFSDSQNETIGSVNGSSYRRYKKK